MQDRRYILNEVKLPSMEVSSSPTVGKLLPIGRDDLSVEPNRTSQGLLSGAGVLSFGVSFL